MHQAEDHGHKDQRRKSGEAYIFHPIAVAKIVASEIGLGATGIAAALLHDVVEDTNITVKDLERMFNPKLAKIVEGLTKIAKVQNEMNTSLQAENFRKMLLTLNDYVRVILIKLADRLHNLRTLGSLDPEKQKRIAQESLEIFAPIASRLGIWKLKWEIEDLAFMYLYPEEYRRIVQLVSEQRMER